MDRIRRQRGPNVSITELEAILRLLLTYMPDQPSGKKFLQIVANHFHHVRTLTAYQTIINKFYKRRWVKQQMMMFLRNLAELECVEDKQLLYINRFLDESLAEETVTEDLTIQAEPLPERGANEGGNTSFNSDGTSNGDAQYSDIQRSSQSEENTSGQSEKVDEEEVVAGPSSSSGPKASSTPTSAADSGPAKRRSTIPDLFSRQKPSTSTKRDTAEQVRGRNPFHTSKSSHRDRSRSNEEKDVEGGGDYTNRRSDKKDKADQQKERRYPCLYDHKRERGVMPECSKSFSKDTQGPEKGKGEVRVKKVAKTSKQEADGKRKSTDRRDASLPAPTRQGPPSGDVKKKGNVKGKSEESDEDSNSALETLIEMMDSESDPTILIDDSSDEADDSILFLEEVKACLPSLVSEQGSMDAPLLKTIKIEKDGGYEPHEDERDAEDEEDGADAGDAVRPPGEALTDGTLEGKNLSAREIMMMRIGKYCAQQMMRLSKDKNTSKSNKRADGSKSRVNDEVRHKRKATIPKKKKLFTEDKNGDFESPEDSPDGKFESAFRHRLDEIEANLENDGVRDEKEATKTAKKKLSTEDKNGDFESLEDSADGKFESASRHKCDKIVASQVNDEERDEKKATKTAKKKLFSEDKTGDFESLEDSANGSYKCKSVREKCDKIVANEDKPKLEAKKKVTFEKDTPGSRPGDNSRKRKKSDVTSDTEDDEVDVEDEGEHGLAVVTSSGSPGYPVTQSTFSFTDKKTADDTVMSDSDNELFCNLDDEGKVISPDIDEPATDVAKNDEQNKIEKQNKTTVETKQSAKRRYALIKTFTLVHLLEEDELPNEEPRHVFTLEETDKETVVKPFRPKEKRIRGSRPTFGEDSVIQMDIAKFEQYKSLEELRVVKSSEGAAYRHCRARMYKGETTKFDEIPILMSDD